MSESGTMLDPRITKVTVNIGVGEGGPVSYTHLRAHETDS